MLRILLAYIAIDKDVVEVYYIVYVDKAYECLVNICLKRRRGVSKAEGHYYILKVTVARTERSLLLVAALNRDPVVSIAKVELRELGGTPEPRKRLLY